MTENPEDERSSQLDAALAKTQRLEREELSADLERQRQADERIVRALSDRPDPTA